MKRVSGSNAFRVNSVPSAAVVLLACIVGACSGDPDKQATEPAARETAPVAASNSPAEYGDPRFPSYLRPPESVEAVMPHARQLVRQKSGFLGKGMGIMETGDVALIVPTVEAEEMVVEAVRKALEERGVKPIVKYDYELVGVTREEALELDRHRRTYTSEHGYMEAANWIDNQFPRPPVARKWLQERRPDLYEKLYPAARELSPQLLVIFEKMKRDSVGQGIQAFLKANPNVRGVFWGKGGGTGLRRAVHPYENKYIGVFTADSRWEVMSAQHAFPGDVWQLAEEQTIEPLVYVDRMHATDPEGTDVNADITEDAAQRWARGAYQRGHLYMFPNQATGRFAYSVVDYPAFQGEWLPREPITKLNGVIGGTANHTGFFPQWKVRFKDGYIVDVQGGGVLGETLKEFLDYPRIKESVFPFHKNPGFWYLYEIAFGSHPKVARNPRLMDQGQLGPERARSGVIHWGLGIRLWHDPDAPVESKSWLDFTAKYDLPRDHGFHTHTYFTTYKVHLRNAAKWVALLDKGRMTSLDNPEVRALASRYGDPDSMLQEDWRPDVPGVTSAGSYAEYASNPWKHVRSVTDQVEAGTYPYFYPDKQPAARRAATN